MIQQFVFRASRPRQKNRRRQPSSRSSSIRAKASSVIFAKFISVSCPAHSSFQLRFIALFWPDFDFVQHAGDHDLGLDPYSLL